MAEAETPQSRIEAAMNALQFAPEVEGFIPYWQIIPGAARQLYIMSFNSNIPTSASGKDVSKESAEKELSKIRTLATKLLTELDGLHKNTIDSLGVYPETLRRIKADLKILDLFAKSAKVADAKYLNTQGRPALRQARAIALRTAEFYAMITGAKPTLTIVGLGGATNDSSFVSLLRVVFEACSVKASLEATAREAVKAFTEKKTKN